MPVTPPAQRLAALRKKVKEGLEYLEQMHFRVATTVLEELADLVEEDEE